MSKLQEIQDVASADYSPVKEVLYSFRLLIHAITGTAKTVVYDIT